MIILWIDQKRENPWGKYRALSDIPIITSDLLERGRAFSDVRDYASGQASQVSVEKEGIGGESCE